MKRHLTSLWHSTRGLTLVEIMLATAILAVVGGVAYKIAIQTSRGERVGSTLIDAQKTAQSTVETILNDIRDAGYGIDPMTQTAVEVASEYRITFVNNRNEDGVVGPGERITYFLDYNENDSNVASTANPHDRVLRRIVSTAADPQAMPAPGKGQIIGVGLLKDSKDGKKKVKLPLFTYLDNDLDTLSVSGSDPTSDKFGKTVSQGDLGAPKGQITARLTGVIVHAVAAASYQDPWSGKYNEADASGTAYVQGTEFMGGGTGLWAIHIDVDTSHLLYPLGKGSTDVHCHQWDDKYDTNVVNYFDLIDASLHNITEDITDVNKRFKVIVANADLSTQAQITVNGVTKKATVYDDTKISDLPIFTLGGLAGTTKLTELKITFDVSVAYTRGVHPTVTGSVRSNIPGKKGEWRNGALTIQAIAVDAAGNPLSPTNTAISSGGVQGVATGNLLYESTTFWHWHGPAYSAAGWDTYDPWI